MCFFVSGVTGEVPIPCQSVQLNVTLEHSELDSDIEEADIRLIAHAHHAANDGTKRLVILSNDTDVLVALLYHCMVTS